MRTRAPLLLAAALSLLAAASAAAQAAGQLSATQATSLQSAVSPEASNRIAAFLASNEYYPVPGDIFTLSLASVIPIPGIPSAGSGGTRADYPMVLGRDYKLNIPITGLIDVKGMDFQKMRQAVISMIMAKMPFDYIEVSLTAPVSFQAFVGGLVNRPGPYDVTSLTKVSDIIQLAGGFKDGATRRRIELRRGDGSLSSVDLASYYQAGAAGGNPLLRPGDRLVVGLAEDVVRIDGAVISPGSYELLDGETLADLLRMANGLGPDALKDRIRVVRRTDSGEFDSYPVDPAKDAGFVLQGYDTIRVPSRSEVPSIITVEGAFYGKAPDGSGIVTFPTQSVMLPVIGSASMTEVSLTMPVKVVLSWWAGMSLYDVMERLGGPTPYALPAESRIYRDGGATEVPFDPIALWKSPEEAQKIMLQPGDYVFVPMKRQVVTVAGEVNLPRTVEYSEKRTAGDYLILAGGLDKQASLSDLWLYDATGKRVKRIGLDYQVRPEDVLVVEPSGWKIFNSWFSQPGPIQAILQVVGFVGAVVTPTYTTVELLKALNVLK